MSTTRRISLDNGMTYVHPDNLDPATLAARWDVLVAAMDDATREAVHAELAPCSEAAFLARYCELAADDIVVG